jgi:hypothetical protein
MNIVHQPEIIDILVEEQEVWLIKQPVKGDHIKVDRGLYTHHGVYISHEEVIHFTGTGDDSILDWSKNEVIKTDLNYFIRGGQVQVKEYTEDELKDLYPVNHIDAYAKACLGDKGYNLIFNNCEHFANTCTLGRFRSNQVEKVFSLIFKDDRRKDMGFFSSIGGKIGGFFKGLFGGGSSGGGDRSVSNTTYEPDKVRVAEIESETK